MQTSPAFTLNKADLLHIGRHILFSAIGAGLLAVQSYLPQVKLNSSEVLALPVVVAIVTALQSWASNHNQG